MRMEWSPDARICIIGAGAAGLVSALALQERGYRDITLVEQEPLVGGKCYTHAGTQVPLEMGANIAFPGSRVHQLAQRTGARVIEWFPIQIFDHRTGQVRPFGSTERPFSIAEQTRAYARLVMELVRHRSLRGHGFHSCKHTVELGTPVTKWLEERGLSVIADAVLPFMVGAGLGYPEDEVPLAYFLKMLQFIQNMGVRDILQRRTYRFENGYQDLWLRVAKQCLGDTKLLLGARVEKVDRPEGAPIRVHTQRGEIVCDALIVTTPLNLVPRFLDVDAQERDLLSRIRCFDMYTIGCTVEGGLPLGLSFIGPHLKSKTTLGHAFAYVPMKGRPEDRSGQFVFYAHGSASVGADVILEHLRDDLGLSGYRILGEPVVKRWPHYFPHVSAQDFSSGFFARLDGLQSHRATYFSGETISGTNVSVVADYADAHIARFFPAHTRS
jgi:hypothetical protein